MHGISGNYIFDAATSEEVLMRDKRLLRAPTIFAAAAATGGRPAYPGAASFTKRGDGSVYFWNNVPVSSLPPVRTTP